MPAQPTWPPPPTTPDLMAAHDEFLTALVCAPMTKPPLSRLYLAKRLRERTWLELYTATRLDLPQCFTIVNSFCDRHTILPQRQGLKVWLSILSPSLLFMVAFILSGIYWWREMNIAPNHMARHLLSIQEGTWDHLFPYFMLIPMTAVLFVNGLIINRRIHREMRVTREKMSQ